MSGGKGRSGGGGGGGGVGDVLLRGGPRVPHDQLKRQQGKGKGRGRRGRGKAASVGGRGSSLRAATQQRRLVESGSDAVVYGHKEERERWLREKRRQAQKEDKKEGDAEYQALLRRERAAQGAVQHQNRLVRQSSSLAARCFADGSATYEASIAVDRAYQQHQDVPQEEEATETYLQLPPPALSTATATPPSSVLDARRSRVQHTRAMQQDGIDDDEDADEALERDLGVAEAEAEDEDEDDDDDPVRGVLRRPTKPSASSSSAAAKQNAFAALREDEDEYDSDSAGSRPRIKFAPAVLRVPPVSTLPTTLALLHTNPDVAPVASGGLGGFAELPPSDYLDEEDDV